MSCPFKKEEALFLGKYKAERGKDVRKKGAGCRRKPKVNKFIEMIKSLNDPDGYAVKEFDEYDCNYYLQTNSLMAKECLKVRGEWALRTLLCSEAEGLGLGPFTNWKTVKPLFGDGSILFMNGDRHEKFRSILREYTSGEALHNSAPVIAAAFDERLRRWADTSASTNDFINVAEECRKLVWGLNCRWVLGTVDESLTEGLRKEMKEFSNGLLSLPVKMGGFSGFSKALKARKRLHELLQEEIVQRQKPNDNEKAESKQNVIFGTNDELPRNFLNHVLKDGEMKGTCLLELLVFALWVSYDTSTALLTHLIYFASQELDVVEKVASEAVEKFGLGGLSEILKNREASYIGDTCRRNLPYTHASIMEMMRVRNILPAVGRQTSCPFQFKTEDGNQIKLPAGTLVSIQYGISMKSHQYFKDSWSKIEPERFMFPRCEDKDNASYCVFGFGKRSCVGKPLALLEARTLFTLLSQYFIELRNEKLHWTLNPARNTDRLMVKIFPRNKRKPTDMSQVFETNSVASQELDHWLDQSANDASTHGPPKRGSSICLSNYDHNTIQPSGSVSLISQSEGPNWFEEDLSETKSDFSAISHYYSPEL